MTDKDRQRLLRATRFWARPESFSLECPRCGKVYQIRIGVNVSHWDPRTSRFICRGKGGCNKTYLIGLVAWPVLPSSGGGTAPRDQVPNERQLSQFRAEGGGWWLPDEAAQRYKRTDTSNITMEEERPERDEDEEEP
jgi:hypothetical protein